MKLAKNDQRFILKWAKKIKAIRKLGGKCNSCGDKNIFHMDFHHPKDDKEIWISKMMTGRWSAIEKEISKCVLLCRNCHGAHHKNCRKIKRQMLDYKKIWSCEKCNYKKNLSCLEFHHVDGATKKFTIGDATRGNGLLVLLEDLMKEVDKCQVLCSNCHSVENIDVARFNRLKDLIYSREINHKEQQCPIDQEEVHSLKTNGMGVTAIAKQLGYAKSTVSRIYNAE